MIVKKLDRRYKLKKIGLANYMMEVTADSFLLACRAMESAYGIGCQFHPGAGHMRVTTNDWFYSYHDINVHSKKQISTDKNGNPVYSHYEVPTYVLRIYFRRHEQAMYLALKLS